MSILKANRIENLTTTDGGINVNNSGQVGVGTSSPGANLEVRGSSSNGQIRIGGSTSGTYSQIYSDNDGVLILNADQGNNAASSYLGLNVDNSERLRIDSSGNVGIGNSSPSNYSSTGRNLVVGTGSSAAGLTVASGATNTGNIYFAAGSTGDDQVRGQIRYNHSIENLDFYTDASLRLRIDGSGDVQARRARSNTAGDVALSVQPSDSTIHYGLRIDSTNNSLNLDRASGTAANLLTVDSSGNVGIGTTSPNGLLTVQANSGRLLTFRNSTTGTGSSDGSYIALNGSDLQISNAESANTIFYTGDTERMRINSSGMLQVGGTTSADNGNKVEITSSSGGTIGFLRNDTSTVQGDPIGAIGFYGNDSNGTYQDAARIEVNADGDHATGDKPAKIEFKVSADGGNTPIQRFIIESDGEQRMFSANPSYTLVLNNGASAGTSYLFLEGRHSATSNTGQTGTRSLSITTNGNIYNTNNSYGQISDVKLKENIVNASSQWDDIKGVQVRNFNFKEETGHPTHTQIGVVAQELETVSPGLVYDTPDVDADRNDLGTVTKTVNYSVLYMKAVKALQEAQTRIEALETQNTAQQTQINDLLSRVTALETAS